MQAPRRSERLRLRDEEKEKEAWWVGRAWYLASNSMLDGGHEYLKKEYTPQELKVLYENYLSVLRPLLPDTRASLYWDFFEDDPMPSWAKKLPSWAKPRWAV